MIASTPTMRAQLLHPEIFTQPLVVAVLAFATCIFRVVQAQLVEQFVGDKGPEVRLCKKRQEGVIRTQHAHTMIEYVACKAQITDRKTHAMRHAAVSFSPCRPRHYSQNRARSCRPMACSGSAVSWSESRRRTLKSSCMEPGALESRSRRVPS